MPLLSLALPLIAATHALLPDRFYNRPGATQGMLTAELRRCRAITTGTMGGTAEGRALTLPIPAPDTDAPPPDASPTPRPTIDDCMVARGWRLYALEAKDRATLETLAPAPLASALGRLVGATYPAYGKLLRHAPRVRLHQR
ncbi:hypothetical protein ACBY01_11855 [Sphingomonas sp. ac-8]|uniref:hypothetical protein n=1 Tax=Sphingomonas sp. ac-8 TaxID=3242977 RepID=UPI003A809D1B